MALTWRPVALRESIVAPMTLVAVGSVILMVAASQ
jgi:hypothetical protein